MTFVSSRRGINKMYSSEHLKVNYFSYVELLKELLKYNSSTRRCWKLFEFKWTLRKQRKITKSLYNVNHGSMICADRFNWYRTLKNYIDRYSALIWSSLYFQKVNVRFLHFIEPRFYTKMKRNRCWLLT